MTHTPWGEAQSTDEIAPGIIRYDTASHGGYWLSPARMAAMPKCLREFQPWAGDGWFEEDCDWTIVALSFPQFFSDEAKQAALATLRNYQPELYAEFVAEGRGV